MKRIKLIVIVLAFLGLIFIVFMIAGYYPTKKINTWVDKEGTIIVAQFVSALALTITVWYQVESNKKIAKRQKALLKKQIDDNSDVAKNQANLLREQNDIALFEKRYELYKKFCEFEYKLSIYNWIHKDFFANEKEYAINIWNEDYTFFEYRVLFGYKIHNDIVEWYNFTTEYSYIMEQIQNVRKYLREKHSTNSCEERCLCALSQKRVDCKRILAKYETEIEKIDISEMGTFKINNIDIPFNIFELGTLKCKIEHSRDEHYLDAVTDMQSQLEFLQRPKI